MGALEDFVKKLEKEGIYNDEAVKKYRYESIEKLLENPQDLLDMVEHYKSHAVPRYDRLKDYMVGKNRSILTRKARKKGKSDVRMPHPFARKIVIFLKGFFIGNPVKVTSTPKSLEKRISEWNIENEIATHNKLMVENNCIFGQSRELLFRDNDGKDRILSIDTDESFFIYDETVQDNIIGGVRFYTREKDEENVMYVSLFSDTDEYLFSGEGEFKQISVNRTDGAMSRPHPYGEVPLNGSQMDRFMLGAYELVIPSIDGYDSEQSDIVNYMVDLSMAKLFVTGNFTKGLSDGEMNDVGHSDVMYGMPALGEDNKTLIPADAKYIAKQYDSQGTEANLKRLENDVYNGALIPNLNDEKFSGNNSGEALKYKTFSLQFMRDDMETYFRKTLEKRYRMLKSSWGVKGDVRFSFTPKLPQGTWEELKAFSEINGQLSNRTKLSLLSSVDDVDEEMAQIDKELYADIHQGGEDE